MNKKPDLFMTYKNEMGDLSYQRVKCIIIFIYLFLAALGLCCCAQAFSSCGEQGLLLVAVRGLLVEVASLVAENGLQVRRLQQLCHVGSVVVGRRLQSAASVVVVYGLSCSAACGIFPDRGSNIGRQVLNHCSTRKARKMYY